MENFPLEFKKESEKVRQVTDPFSTVHSDLFSSDFVFSEKVNKDEEFNFKKSKDDDYFKPNVLSWNLNKLAKQITLISSKFFS